MMIFIFNFTYSRPSGTIFPGELNGSPRVDSSNYDIYFIFF